MRNTALSGICLVQVPRRMTGRISKTMLALKSRQNKKVTKTKRKIHLSGICSTGTPILMRRRLSGSNLSKLGPEEKVNKLLRKSIIKSTGNLLTLRHKNITDGKNKTNLTRMKKYLNITGTNLLTLITPNPKKSTFIFT